MQLLRRFLVIGERNGTPFRLITVKSRVRDEAGDEHHRLDSGVGVEFAIGGSTKFGIMIIGLDCCRIEVSCENRGKLATHCSFWIFSLLVVSAKKVKLEAKAKCRKKHQDTATHANWSFFLYQSKRLNLPMR